VDWDEPSDSGQTFGNHLVVLIRVPAGLEDEYQIDLRATDMLGNVRLTSKVWRGVIDTQAPRVVITGSRGATSWFDYNSGPCGGRGCNESFEARRAQISDVVVVHDATGFHRFWWAVRR